MAEPITVTQGIKDLLVGASIGVFPPDTGDWIINIGRLTDEQDQMIAVSRAGGKAPNPKWNIDFPSVQVRVRGGKNGYLAAEQKARNVKDCLLGLPSQDLNGDRWTAINMIGDIAPMGWDPNDRPIFALNFALIIEPAVAGNRST